MTENGIADLGTRVTIDKPLYGLSMEDKKLLGDYIVKIIEETVNEHKDDIEGYDDIVWFAIKKFYDEHSDNSEFMIVLIDVFSGTSAKITLDDHRNDLEALIYTEMYIERDFFSLIGTEIENRIDDINIRKKLTTILAKFLTDMPEDKDKYYRKYYKEVILPLAKQEISPLIGWQVLGIIAYNFYLYEVIMDYLKALMG